MSFSFRLQPSRRSPFPLLCSAALLALGAGFPLGCDSTPEIKGGPDGACVKDEQCEADEFCDNGTCAVVCESCGFTCARTEECPVGQFCTQSGTCQQQCTPGRQDECPNAMVCNVEGKCVADADIDVPTTSVAGGAPGGDGDGDGDTDVECIDVKVDFAPVIPNVVLLIDQSGSMTDEASFKEKVAAAITAGDYVADECPDSVNGSSATIGWDDDEEPDYDWRWNVVRNILFNPVTGIIKPLEDQVRFGLTNYSSIAGFGDPMGSDYPRTCPMLTEVGIAFGNHQAMLDSFPCSILVQDTPTRESLTAVAEKFAATDLEGPKIIVLATDGEPDTCACSDFNSQSGRDPAICSPNVAPETEYMGQMYPVDKYEQIKVALEAQRIHDTLGITIEVINVGLTSLKGHLDSVAALGGAVSGESIDGTSPGALVDAFRSVIDGVRSCVIDLDGTIAEGLEDTGTITLDGQELEYDGVDGWKVVLPSLIAPLSQIELLGTACDAIKSGGHDIDVSFPCESFDPILR